MGWEIMTMFSKWYYPNLHSWAPEKQLRSPKYKCYLNTLTNQYTQIDGVHRKITHFKHILGCTFFKIPITHTQNSVLLCKLFSMAIHSMGYFHHIMRLYAGEWKLMFLYLHQLGHYIIYFCSTLKSLVASHLLYLL